MRMIEKIKRDLPPGQWQDEPDEEDWVDEVTGLHCRIMRHYEMGTLCGYVGVPKDHPLWGHSCNLPMDYFELNENELWWRIHVLEMKEYLLADIGVHGGLTYSGMLDSIDDIHYFGFDCTHPNDLIPGLGNVPGMYRDWVYVKHQVLDLAKQLAKIRSRNSR